LSECCERARSRTAPLPRQARQPCALQDGSERAAGAGARLLRQEGDHVAGLQAGPLCRGGGEDARAGCTSGQPQLDTASALARTQRYAQQGAAEHGTAEQAQAGATRLGRRAACLHSSAAQQHRRRLRAGPWSGTDRRLVTAPARRRGCSSAPAAARALPERSRCTPPRSCVRGAARRASPAGRHGAAPRWCCAARQTAAWRAPHAAGTRPAGDRAGLRGQSHSPWQPADRFRSAARCRPGHQSWR